MYDVAIIGTGPAGISAALTLKLHNKNIIWFGSENLSPKVEKSEKIANYPGVSMVSGPDLNKAFKEQIEEAGLEITDKMVTNITYTKKGFMLLGGNDIYEAKTVLLALGAAGPKGLPGETELLGKGVSYCATCDGFLYKGKTVGVYCGSKDFEHEVAYLAEIADKVYVYTPYKDCKVEGDNIVKLESPVVKVEGENSIEGITLKDGNKVQLDGLFFLRTSVAPGVLAKGIELDGSDIQVDRHMATNRPGVYGAGDCTGRPYQLTKACGEGNIAAHSIIEYLSHLERNIGEQ